MAKSPSNGAQARKAWPQLAMVKHLYKSEVAGFPDWLQAKVDAEALLVLQDAYGKDPKPDVLGFHIPTHEVREYMALKQRLVDRILNEANYRGRRWFALNLHAHEAAIMDKTEANTATVAAEEKDTRKHKYIETAHGEFRENSVLHIIYSQFAKKGGATKDEIHAALKAQFPDWDTSKSTVNCQIDRMGTERGFDLGRTKDGKYGISPGKGVFGSYKDKAMAFSGIEGYDKTRVLSPEAAAKKEAAVKVKADKTAAKEKEKADKATAKAAAAAAEAKKKEEAAAKEKVAAEKLAAAEADKKAKADKVAAAAKKK